MTNVNVGLNNFTSGEISPKLYGRFDLAAYTNGARRMENFIIQSAGAAIYRGGFHFIAETKSNNRAFLYRFQFSDIQAYILEFTDLNIRIYKDRGIVVGPIDVTTPYLESEMFQLKFAQTATDLYIVHPNHQPRKLTRTSDTSWTLTIHAPTGLVPPFNTQAVTNITQADPAVVTYSGDDNYNDGDIIRMDNVSGMTEVNGVQYIVANVNTGANTFELNDTDGNNIDSTGFTAYTSGGDLYNVSNCPSAATFYEQRLIYGGSINSPETLWFSKSADFDDFTQGTGATDGIKYTVAVGEDANNIQWIKGAQDLLVIGGIGDVVKATGGQGQEAIAPDQISIKPTNTFGVADINPIGRNQAVIYMDKTGRTQRSFEADEFGVYSPADLNVAADHITLSGITDIAYQEGRPSVSWCAKTNGELVGVTLDRKNLVQGWHRHTTLGEFISVATVPREGDYDDLYVCVKRNINGIDKFYIEFLNDNPDFPRREDFVTGRDTKEDDDDTFQRALFEAQKTYIHVDSALTFDGTTRGVDAGAILSIGAVSGSSVSFTTDQPVFVSGDVGNEIWVKSVDGTRFGQAEIVTFNSTTDVDCDILVDFDSTTNLAAGDWYITANEVSGLGHLEGEVVQVVTDGAIHTDETVSSGTISLDSQSSVVHVGFGFTGLIETNDFEGGGTTGITQTKRKSVYKVGLRLLDTAGLSFGTDAYDLNDRLLREAVDLMDNPPPLFTGNEIINFDDGGDEGWERGKRIICLQDLALPAAVQMVVPYYTVSNVD